MAQAWYNWHWAAAVPTRRAPATLVAHQPSHRRLDPPATGQQRAPDRRVVEGLAGAQAGVIVRDEHSG